VLLRAPAIIAVVLDFLISIWTMGQLEMPIPEVNDVSVLKLASGLSPQALWRETQDART
jgi:hypothetical protein